MVNIYLEEKTKTLRNKEIREEYESGKKITELSKLYKISKQRIEQIVRRPIIKNAVRKKIINSYDFKCSWCGILKYNGLNIHHIDMNPLNNNENNLIPLCKTCHIKFHSLIKETKERDVAIALEEIENKKNENKKTIKCKKCQKELFKGIDYLGKELCKKCYQHEYITSKWKKNKKYRKEQRARIDKWQKDNPKKLKEMYKKYYQNKKLK
jgi:hypothetical protein